MYDRYFTAVTLRYLSPGRSMLNIHWFTSYHYIHLKWRIDRDRLWTYVGGFPSKAFQNKLTFLYNPRDTADIHGGRNHKPHSVSHPIAENFVAVSHPFARAPSYLTDLTVFFPVNPRTNENFFGNLPVCLCTIFLRTRRYLARSNLTGIYGDRSK